MIARDFSSDTIFLLLNIAPSFIARKGYQGRERLVAAFKRYFSSACHTQGSFLISERSKIMNKHGINLDDQARFEAVNGIAVLANTVPTAFWCIYNAFRHPNTLKRLRQEAETVITQENRNGTATQIINMSKLRDIPLLVSHLQESIRHRSAGAGTRMVLEDTVLENQYLLKKDTALMIPNRSMHFDEKSWGSDVQDFREDRFAGGKSKPHPAAFRGFGGGSTLCPGRFFAMTEILAMLTMMVLRYEIEPISCDWDNLLGNESNMSLTVAPPLGETKVKFSQRKGWERYQWEYAV